VPQIARNTSIAGLLQHVDIPTTLAALAGTTVSGNDGFDVWDVVATGAASPRQEVPLNIDFSRLAKVLGAVLGSCCGGSGAFNGLIQGKWKIVSGWSGFYDGYSSNDPYTITPADPDQTYVKVDGHKVWLFDIEADPEERHNIAKDNHGIVHKMLKRIDELGDNSTGYVGPQPNLPHMRALPGLLNGTWAPFLGDEEFVLEDDNEVFLGWPIGGVQRVMQLV
jgi:arylsulfatase A-like enzyme